MDTASGQCREASDHASGDAAIAPSRPNRCMHAALRHASRRQPRPKRVLVYGGRLAGETWAAAAEGVQPGVAEAGAAVGHLRASGQRAEPPLRHAGRQLEAGQWTWRSACSSARPGAWRTMTMSRRMTPPGRSAQGSGQALEQTGACTRKMKSGHIPSVISCEGVISRCMACSLC